MTKRATMAAMGTLTSRPVTGSCSSPGDAAPGPAGGVSGCVDDTVLRDTVTCVVEGLTVCSGVVFGLTFFPVVEEFDGGGDVVAGGVETATEVVVVEEMVEDVVVVEDGEVVEGLGNVVVEYGARVVVDGGTPVVGGLWAGTTRTRRRRKGIM
jgi:hypothetical protein